MEVHDTGIGIDPEFLERIFDPFEQVGEGARRRGGLGLGLAISRAVAETHRGRLTAHSPGKGRGATFRLELMAEPSPALAQEPASRRTEPTVRYDRSHRPCLKILLVEDNTDTLRYLGITLRRRGHEVAEANCLEVARQAVADTKFDLLISDIELPDGSGLELMASCAERGPGHRPERPRVRR